MVSIILICCLVSFSLFLYFLILKLSNHNCLVDQIVQSKKENNSSSWGPREYVPLTLVVGDYYLTTYALTIVEAVDSFFNDMHLDHQVFCSVVKDIEKYWENSQFTTLVNFLSILFPLIIYCFIHLKSDSLYLFLLQSTSFATP